MATSLVSWFSVNTWYDMPSMENVSLIVPKAAHTDNTQNAMDVIQRCIDLILNLNKISDSLIWCESKYFGCRLIAVKAGESFDVFMGEDKLRVIKT